MTTPPSLNMQQLLQRVGGIRDGLLTMRDELATTEVVGDAGGGVVSVTVRGTGEVVGIRLDPAAARLSLATLEDLFLTAAQAAQASARALTETRVAPFTDPDLLR